MIARTPLLLALPAALAATAAQAGVPAADAHVGSWVDPDGATFDIEARDGRAVLVKATLGGSETLEVRKSAWSAAEGLEFSVRVPSRGVVVHYKVLAIDGDVMDTVWWSSTPGEGGRERLKRVRPEKDPKNLLGVWEDRSVKARYWIQEVDGEPTVIGGVDSRGAPKMVTERGTRGAVVVWTVKLPSTGYALTYRCEPGVSREQLACTWSNVSPEGERRQGSEILRRMPE